MLPIVSSALLIGAALAPQSPGGGDTVLFTAPRIIVAPGVELENEALLVRNGTVALVGPEIPADVRRNTRVVELTGTVVPGFVNPHTHLSLGEDLAERISALTPDLLAADAFDPFDERLLFNARHGVTTLGLAPLSANTFSGVTAVVRGGEMGEVVSESAYLKLALVAESFDQGRYPTSRMGAAEMIRASFELAREPLAPPTPAQRALRGVVEGSTRLAIHAREHNAIQAALELYTEIGTKPLLIGGDQSDELLESMAAAGTSVILSPLHPGMTQKALELPARLEKAGIAFSFMADPPPPVSAVGKPQLMPGLPPGIEIYMNQGPVRGGPAPTPGHPENMRLSAALAVRHGLSRRAALAALTDVPATQCGVEETCGALRQGRLADFSVWSGDPIDLTSRLIAVYVGGERIDMAR